MQSAGSEGGYYQDIAAFAIRFKGKTYEYFNDR